LATGLKEGVVSLNQMFANFSQFSRLYHVYFVLVSCVQNNKIFDLRLRNASSLQRKEHFEHYLTRTNAGLIVFFQTAAKLPSVGTTVGHIPSKIAVN